MSFATLDISELPEDHDDDYAIEFTTDEARLGIMMSEQEFRGLGDGIQKTLEDGVESIDEKNVSEL